MKYPTEQWTSLLNYWNKGKNWGFGCLFDPLKFASNQAHERERDKKGSQGIGVMQKKVMGVGEGKEPSAPTPYSLTFPETKW